MSDITIDIDKAQRAAQTLKSKPPTAAEISKDPKAFLAAQGVGISKKVEAMIKGQGAYKSPGVLKSAAQPRQAAVIHIDV